MIEKLLENTPLTIAVVGKGGVGKSVITALLAKVISQSYNYKLLLIDADPTHPHLSNMVKLVPKQSLEAIRNDVIENTLKNGKSPKTIAKNLDFKVYNSMAESKDFCLFSIGQPEGPGCFCPSNTLLKRVIESISKDFDIILMDCEAGLEQINRLVLESVDIILIVTDISLRSVETANSIRNSAKKFTNYKKLGIIVNKVKGNVDLILEKLKQLNFSLLGTIPEDETIIKQDLEGKPIIDIPEDAPSLRAVKDSLKKILHY